MQKNNMKSHLDIKVPKETLITVVGDIHCNLFHFEKLLEKINPSNKMWIVSCGDVYDKGPEENSKLIFNKIKDLQKEGICWFVKGNHELRRIRKSLKSSEKVSDELFWVSQQPLCVSFLFHNQTRLTVLHGGVKPTHTWKDLEANSEIAYIRKIDSEGEPVAVKWVDRKPIFLKEGKYWGEIYDGRFGYIASGHNSQIDGVPKFYKYCCNLDTRCYDTGILTAQVFGPNGRMELIQIKNENFIDILPCLKAGDSL